MEQLSFTVDLNGAELWALIELARKVCGHSESTYRSYTHTLANDTQVLSLLNGHNPPEFFACSSIIAHDLPEKGPM